MLLSFIIPYYNAERTILGTLSSIYDVGLDISSFEVIIVDDCSTTPVEIFLKDYSYPSNLRIIRHSVNKKQGAGRNTGIKAAMGDYIAFVDADDITCKGICNAIAMAKANNPDIVACLYEKTQSDGKTMVTGTIKSSGTIVSGQLFCERFVDPSTSLITPCYLFSRQYLLSLYFPYEEYVYMEDADWVARHLFYAKNICLCESVVYRYTFNERSVTHTSSFIHSSGWVKTGYRKLQLSKEIAEVSPLFSSIIQEDALWNIEGAMSKLWTIKHIRSFYQSVEKRIWDELKEYKWPSLVSFLIKHHELSCIVLGAISPLLRAFKRIA